jgi:hypothetical protein
MDRDFASLDVVDSADEANGAGGEEVLEDGTLLADLLHGDVDVLLGDSVDIGVVLAGARAGGGDGGGVSGSRQRRA